MITDQWRLTLRTLETYANRESLHTREKLIESKKRTKNHLTQKEKPIYY